MNIDEARDWLQAERDRLDGLAARSAASADEAIEADDPMSDTKGGQGTHPGDSGTDRETQMEDEGLASDAARQRDDIDAALQRIADGTWGTCVTCGKEIDAERLDALPQAAYCRDHR